MEVLAIFVLLILILLIIPLWPKKKNRLSQQAVRSEDHAKALELTEEFKDILTLLNKTDRSVFITGKAGTGKSTLLKYFIKKYPKKIRCPGTNRCGSIKYWRSDNKFLLSFQAICFRARINHT